MGWTLLQESEKQNESASDCGFTAEQSHEPDLSDFTFHCLCSTEGMKLFDRHAPIPYKESFTEDV